MSMELGPYSNFHELNQDWFLNEFNKVLAEWAAMNKSFNDLNEAFNNLHDYVHDYFKNLNVQEEINNKLDEMASSGELSLILANYIRLIHSFIYLSDMVATNLKNGDIAITCNTSQNILDGGCKYVITNIKKSYSVQLANGLYANFIGDRFKTTCCNSPNGSDITSLMVDALTDFDTFLFYGNNYTITSKFNKKTLIGSATTKQAFENVIQTPDVTGLTLTESNTVIDVCSNGIFTINAKRNIISGCVFQGADSGIKYVPIKGGWEGENTVKESYFVSCDVGIEFKYLYSTSMGDGYITDNIFVRCKNSIKCEQIFGYIISRNHDYSNGMILNSASCLIQDNYMDCGGNTAIEISVANYCMITGNLFVCTTPETTEKDLVHVIPSSSASSIVCGNNIVSNGKGFNLFNFDGYTPGAISNNFSRVGDVYSNNTIFKNYLGAKIYKNLADGEKYPTFDMTYDGINVSYNIEWEGTQSSATDVLITLPIAPSKILYTSVPSYTTGNEFVTSIARIDTSGRVTVYGTGNLLKTVYLNITFNRSEYTES